MRVRIAEREVGDGCPVYVVAEAGSNHQQDFTRALLLIDGAADAGADACKFQLFKAPRLYPPGPQMEALLPYELPPFWLGPLAGHCERRGIDFLCTPFDEEAADLIAPYVPAFKVSSYDITNTALLRKVAGFGKPILLSTGGATMDEVFAVEGEHVSWERSGPFVYLHCTAAYPAPPDTMNLLALATMRRELWSPLGILIGLSDHSTSVTVVPAMAVALGACVIEKHFKLPDSAGPDAGPFALTPDDLRRYVAAIREAESALGDGVKRVLPVEEELRRTARRDPATGLRVGGVA